MDLTYVSEHVPADLRDWQPGDAFLAGGTWLFSEPQPTVRRLLDLRALDWTPLVAGADGLEIGATCTVAELASWSPPPHWPVGVLVRQCCEALLGSFKIWNEATVGGNVCLALPAGPMTSLTAALDGICEIWAPDGTMRYLPVIDLVLGVRSTALAPGEVLRAIRVPDPVLRSRTALRQASLSNYGRSAALVIARVEESGATVVTVTASTPRPVRVGFASLPRPVDAVDATLDAVGGDWHDDLHGAPAWRAALTARMVDEVVAELRDPP